MQTRAILLLIFNRPEPTRRVMEAIRAGRPPRLYVAADGHRASWAGEAERFRENNLGWRVGESAALDRFFEHAEKGIVLEDDCVRAQSFFPYCAELLARYRDDKRIMCTPFFDEDRHGGGDALIEYRRHFPGSRIVGDPGPRLISC
jgi:hypothetical protein